jgi:hypothetical protein
VPISRLNQPFGLIDASTTIKEVHFASNALSQQHFSPSKGSPVSLICATTTTPRFSFSSALLSTGKSKDHLSAREPSVPVPWRSTAFYARRQRTAPEGCFRFWPGKCAIPCTQSKGHLSQRLFCVDRWRCVSLDKQSKETFIEKAFMSWQPVVRFALGVKAEGHLRELSDGSLGEQSPYGHSSGSQLILISRQDQVCDGRK